MGRAYSCWTLNCWCITWQIGFRRLIKTLFTWTFSVVWIRSMSNTSFRELTLLACSGFIVPGSKKGQSSSYEPNKLSASQEIFHILWNPKIPHHIHKHPPLTAILIQINPFDDILPISYRSILVLYIPPKSRSSRCSLSIRYPNRNPVCTSPIPHACFISHPSLFFLFDHRIMFGEQYRP